MIQICKILHQLQKSDVLIKLFDISSAKWCIFISLYHFSKTDFII